VIDEVDKLFGGAIGIFTVEGIRFFLRAARQLEI
jgi:hypothetical protein